MVAVLNGIILNTRPKASAQKYASIWTDKGAFSAGTPYVSLAGYLAKDGYDGLDIDYAMRYGAPRSAAPGRDARARSCTRILVVPMCPQYSASTTAAVVNKGRPQPGALAQ